MLANNLERGLGTRGDQVRFECRKGRQDPDEHPALGVSSENDSCSEKSSVPPVLVTCSAILWKSSDERASLSTRVETMAPEPSAQASSAAARPGRFFVVRPDAPLSSYTSRSAKPRRSQ